MSVANIKRLLDGGHQCVRIVTNEESHAYELALGAAAELRLDAWGWSATRGVFDAMVGGQAAAPDTHNPTRGLVHLRTKVTGNAMIILLDMADHLSDSLNLRALRELIEYVHLGALGRTHIIMIDHSDQIPPVVGAMSVRYEVEAPDDAQIEAHVKKTLSRHHKTKAINATMTSAGFRAVVQNLRGMTRRQIEKVISECVVVDRAFTDDDLTTIQRGKRLLLQDAGVLEFVEAPTSLEQIGGLGALKAWLAARVHSFDQGAAEYGIEPPRGVMLLGVQGAGKSLAAKAIATAWRRPLMRLDPGALFDKYIGETERRLRDALRQAERMAPVIMWIDEIEKGFASAASQSADGGVTRRMFGSLLTWMQEHRAPVFLVATANDIESLPPELLRKGRFDEVFFVDLPQAPARRQIFHIHLKKRKKDPAAFDLEALAAATEGYSGAEIEQAVIAALHESFASKSPLTTEGIRAAAERSPPLAVTMRERVQDLRNWAKGRCVPAD